MSPNARPNRFAKSKATAAARTLSRREVYKAKNTWDFPRGFVVTSIKYVMYWKTTRGKQDDTNLIASCKAYEDGLQDAVNQDDSTWEMEKPVHYVDENNSRLEIHINIEQL